MVEIVPDNDPTFGGEYHQPTGPKVADNDPSYGPGGQTAKTGLPPGGILNSTLLAAESLPRTVWNFVSGTASMPFSDAETRNAGIERGVRDLSDKLAGAPPNLGAGLEGPAMGPIFMTPSTPDEVTAQKAQNARDRAAFETKYGDDPAAQAWRGWTQTAMLAPAMAVGGEALEAIPAIGPFLAGSGGIGTRGLVGVGERAASRATGGLIGGGAGAAATLDPNQPILPQIAAGATTGALTTPIAGAAGDVVIGPIRRLTGDAMYKNVPGGTDPATGLPATSWLDPRSWYQPTLQDDTVTRALQARDLIDEKVPVYTHQITNSPFQQGAQKYTSTVPFTGAGSDVTTQLQAVRAAVLRKVTGDGNGTDSVATPKFFDDAGNAIDQLYNGSIRSVNNIPAALPPGGNAPFGRPLGLDVRAIRDDIPPTLQPGEQNAVHAALDRVQDQFVQNNGKIDGSTYQGLTSRTGSTLSPLYDSDNPTVRALAWKIKSMLDDRARSVMTPDQVTDFNNANQRFRALKTVQSVTNSDGTFLPSELAAEAKSVTDKYGGKGTVDDLARNADAIISPTIPPKVAQQQGSSTVPIAAGVMAAKSALTNPYLAAVMAVLGQGTGQFVQGLNRRGGPRAINTALAGGGNTVGDVSTALRTLLPAWNQSQPDQ
jgi:hypothetical protein